MLFRNLTCIHKLLLIVDGNLLLITPIPHPILSILTLLLYQALLASLLGKVFQLQFGLVSLGSWHLCASINQSINHHHGLGYDVLAGACKLWADEHWAKAPPFSSYHSKQQRHVLCCRHPREHRRSKALRNAAMHLLKVSNDGNPSLIRFIGGKTPNYAILSHTWEADNQEAERLRAHSSHTTVISKRLVIPHGPLLGWLKNFKKVCPHRNLYYRISMQLRGKQTGLGRGIDSLLYRLKALNSL